MFAQILGSLARAALQVFTGYLLTKGWIDAETAAEFLNSGTTVLAGILLGVGSVVWSIIDKKKLLNK